MISKSKKKVFAENWKRFFVQIQVISKKKGLSVQWNPLLLVDIISGFSPSLTPISFGGGGYFRF